MKILTKLITFVALLCFSVTASAYINIEKVKPTNQPMAYSYTCDAFNVKTNTPINNAIVSVIPKYYLGKGVVAGNIVLIKDGKIIIDYSEKFKSPLIWFNESNSDMTNIVAIESEQNVALIFNLHNTMVIKDNQYVDFRDNVTINAVKCIKKEIPVKIPNSKGE